MFAKRSFKFKLLVLCFILSSVSAIVGGISYRSLGTVSKSYDEIATVNLQNIRNAGDMFLAFRNIRISLRTLGLRDIPADLAKESIAEVVKNIELYEKAKKSYMAIEFMPGEDELFKKVDASWADFQILGKNILAWQKSPKAEDQEKMMRAFFYDCPEIAQRFTTDMNKLLDFHKASADTRVTTAQGTAASANWWNFVLIGICMTTAMIVGWIFSSSVAKTLTKISSHLADDAGKLSQAANQISAASVNLSSATTQQAAAIQETTAAVEETSAMIAKNAENAKISNEVSGQSQDTATKGHQAVNEMLHSIEEIAQSNTEIMQQIEQSNKEISDIVTVIAEIGNKTKVINDIVFQTKLLSFNASVEAARAGEHGKGFAVVAEEVGNLAEMSGGAAKEISEMLDSSIKKVEQIVSNTKSRVSTLIATGKQKVDAGTATAKRCSAALEEIVSNVERVSGLIAEISTASDEQARGISEINKAMSEMDNVAQQNSAASQQTSSSAESLNTQVHGLHQMVKELNGVISGGGENHAPAAPATVIPMPKAARTEAHSSSSARVHKKAAGYDIPSGNDPQFED